MSDNEPRPDINAAPTKAFFVDMMVRDIGLEQAILDLVDNSVDGAKRLHPGLGQSLEGRTIQISMDQHHFRMIDNCGGFGTIAAREYAFRFGRSKQAIETPHSIGQFGVGMKRALFKFGRHFVVRSATPDEVWAVDVDVDAWEANDNDWTFKWSDFGAANGIDQAHPGTDIFVDALRPAVASRISTTHFRNTVIDLIKSKHRQFISQGLSISVNTIHVSASSVYLLVGDKLQPGVDAFVLKDAGEKDVLVDIKVGLGTSSPREAGWFVICNGRIVLEADRRGVTGWGLLEAEADRVIMPSFHNQFARFRGIVAFDSEDSKRVPWTTTKTDVDLDSTVWQRTFPRMMEMMRPAITFLNELDADIEEYTRDASPLYRFLTKVGNNRADSFTAKSEFTAPARQDVVFEPPTVKIQYSRKVEDIDFLKAALSVGSAKAVGETTFDLILKRQRG